MFNQVLTGILGAIGGPDASSIKIQDPNSLREGAPLEGSAAAASIVARTSLGKVNVPYGSRNYLKELGSNLEGDTSSSSDHADTSDYSTYDPTASGTSEERIVTAKEDISSEEAAIFDEKIKELKNKGVIGNASIPFVGKYFTKVSSGITLTAISPRDIAESQITEATHMELYNGKHIYPCASLIELLLSLKDKIYINGDFDLGRNTMIEGWKEMKNDARINDHISGRGIDVRYIGDYNQTKETSIDLAPKNSENYKVALIKLLDALNSIPSELHPDLIVFDDRLADEFGEVKGGYEIDNPSQKLNGIIQKKYSNLRKINFVANLVHRNHIHISFSPQRAGNYIDYTESSTGSAWGSTGSRRNNIFYPTGNRRIIYSVNWSHEKSTSFIQSSY